MRVFHSSNRSLHGLVSTIVAAAFSLSTIVGVGCGEPSGQRDGTELRANRDSDKPSPNQSNGSNHAADTNDDQRSPAVKTPSETENQLAQEARAGKLNTAIQSLAEGDATAGPKSLAAFKDFVDHSDRQAGDFEFAREICMYLEMLAPANLASEAYAHLGDAFAKSGDAAVATKVKQVSGKAQARLGLVGKPLEPTGHALDGKPLDWKAYKDKVVLVDFWATWCGPCIAEMENIKKHYAEYHDRGFEVLGINLDDDRESTETFLKKSPLPWSVLYSSDPKAVGMEGDPNAVRCGVAFLPTTILIGKDGKVLAIGVRGEDLGKRLAELLKK